MLGMAATKRGSQDPQVARLLQLNFPPLLPSMSAGVYVSFTTSKHCNADATVPATLQISALRQSAAVISLGLLYQGSAHVNLVEILMKEINSLTWSLQRFVRCALAPQCPQCLLPHLPSGECRESYALCAGIGLGLIMLGLGAKSVKPENALLPPAVAHATPMHSRRGRRSLSPVSDVAEEGQDPFNPTLPDLSHLRVEDTLLRYTPTSSFVLVHTTQPLAAAGTSQEGRTLCTLPTGISVTPCLEKLQHR